MGGSAGDYEGLALNQQDSISASFRTLAMQTDQTAPRPLGNMLKQKNIVIPIDTFSFSTFQTPKKCVSTCGSTEVVLSWSCRAAWLLSFLSLKSLGKKPLDIWRCGDDQISKYFQCIISHESFIFSINHC